jgi:hypothetical protein
MQIQFLLDNLSINRSLSLSQSLLNAIFLNLFVTGIFTIVYSFPVYKLLPERYYSINNPKLFKSFCNLIKIEYFKKILLITFWRKKQNKKYFFNGTRNGFAEFKINTMKSEFGHFMGFIIVMILTIYIGIKINMVTALMVFIINIIFNFYPFILQRYHRQRLARY